MAEETPKATTRRGRKPKETPEANAVINDADTLKADLEIAAEAQTVISAVSNEQVVDSFYQTSQQRVDGPPANLTDIIPNPSKSVQDAYIAGLKNLHTPKKVADKPGFLEPPARIVENGGAPAVAPGSE